MDHHEPPSSGGVSPRDPGEGDATHDFSTPAADVFETAGEIVIVMDVPGVDADGFDVDLQDGGLSVTARRRQLDERGAAILTEYQLSDYFRYFRVPKSVDQSRISATLADGVLRLVLPKTGRVVPRKIPLRKD